MPKPEIADLLRWYELEEALERFSDPDIAERIKLVRPDWDTLGKAKPLVMHRHIWHPMVSKSRYVRSGIEPDRRNFVMADSELGKLLVERHLAFHSKLIAGEVFASAKRRISDENRFFVEPGDWRHLNFSQDELAFAIDGSETFYSLRFRNIAPFIFGSVESKLEDADLKGLKAQDQAILFALKLFPAGRIEPTLKATQTRIKDAMKKAELKPVSENTITTALEKLGFYQPKPHLKKP